MIEPLGSIRLSLGNVDLTSSFSSPVAPSVATIYDAARQEFLAFFPRRDVFIWKLVGYERWQKAKGPLLDAQIAGVISDEGRGLFRGCYWAHKTQHAVLDIDTESKYHNAGELVEFTEKLAAIGLKAKPYQSSDSGGWHIYLFFDDWTDSDEVSQTLKRWLKGLGYEIGSGKLEVFPSGNALRLPLQQGFGWLGPDGNLQLKRGEIQESKAIALFLEDSKVNACNWQNAKSLIDRQIQAASEPAGELAPEHSNLAIDEGFDNLFKYRLIKENYEKGRKYWQEGLTEKDTRHDAIICVEHYLWHGDQLEGIPAYPGRFNDQTRARLIRSWLEQKHNGLSGHVLAGNWQTIEADIERAVVWRADGATRTHEPYACTERAQDVLIARTRRTGRVWTMDDLKKGNDKREKQARQKIRRAVSIMCAAGEQLTRNAIAQRSGCSPNTVSKHADLWSFLTSRSGDKSRGVRGDLRLLPGSLGSEERALDRLSSLADSGQFGQEHLSAEAATPFVSPFQSVAPLAICPAKSQPSNSQSADQALWVQAEVFTPGPTFDGIRAEGQMGAGGVSDIWERLKNKSQQASHSKHIQKSHFECLLGNHQTIKEESVFKIGKTLFILPYGSQRRPKPTTASAVVVTTSTAQRSKSAAGTVQLSVPENPQSLVKRKARWSRIGAAEFSRICFFCVLYTAHFYSPALYRIACDTGDSD